MSVWTTDSCSPDSAILDLNGAMRHAILSGFRIWFFPVVTEWTYR